MCVCVCVSVCVFTYKYIYNRHFPELYTSLSERMGLSCFSTVLVKGKTSLPLMALLLRCFLIQITI